MAARYYERHVPLSAYCWMLVLVLDAGAGRWSLVAGRRWRAVKSVALYDAPRRLEVRAFWKSAPFGSPRPLEVRALLEVSAPVEVRALWKSAPFGLDLALFFSPPLVHTRHRRIKPAHPIMPNRRLTLALILTTLVGLTPRLVA